MLIQVDYNITTQLSPFSCYFDSNLRTHASYKVTLYCIFKNMTTHDILNNLSGHGLIEFLNLDLLCNLFSLKMVTIHPS